MEFIEKLDEPVPMKNYDGDTYYIYPVNVEATPQEKNDLLELLEFVSKKRLASTGGYNNFPDILTKIKEQKDEGDRLSLFDMEFRTIKLIFSELDYTQPVHYGFSQRIYDYLEREIKKLFEKIFEKELANIRIDDDNTHAP